MDHEKAGILEEIFQGYEEKKQAAEGIVTAVLRYTTLPLEEQKEKMEAWIKKTMHAGKVSWVLEEDASLLGEMCIRDSHMGMKICGISCISNLACGLTDQPLSHQEVQETADRVAPLFEKLVTASIVNMAKGE